MRSDFLRHYYQLHGLREGKISPQEQRRIAATLNLVPSSWRSVIDVGCGDGRVSRSLIDQGLEVVGLDWSESSLQRFPGSKVVADIQEPWPLKCHFDGAICTEVLEHLPPAEAGKIVGYIKQNTRSGFIISVPAREALETHTVSCPCCCRPYHVWGHVQSFVGFEDVDYLVGQKSIQRAFVCSDGVRPSVALDRLKKNLGYYPYEDNALCPFCSSRLPMPQRPPFFRLTSLWLLGKLEAWSSSLRPAPGWFVCRFTQ